jgi:hypothetical protein
MEVGVSVGARFKKMQAATAKSQKRQNLKKWKG